jgi:hypothetical protein
MNKFLISLAIGGLTLSANIWAGAARAAWFTEYSCDYSNVTLREVGKGNYRYEATSPLGNILLSNGRRTMGNKSWIYSFSNGDTVYQVEDIWGTSRKEPISSYLKVIYKQSINGEFRSRTILDKACFKKNYGA